MVRIKLCTPHWVICYALNAAKKWPRPKPSKKLWNVMFVRDEGLRNSQICLSFGVIEGLRKLSKVRPHERQTTKPPAVREETAKTGPEKTPHPIASKKQDLRSLQKDLILLFSVFHQFLPRKVEQWPCCWCSECIYLALSLHFYREKLNNSLAADAAHVYI